MDMCAMVPKPLATNSVSTTTAMSNLNVASTDTTAASSTQKCMGPPKSVYNFSFFAKSATKATPSAALGAPLPSNKTGAAAISANKMGAFAAGSATQLSTKSNTLTTVPPVKTGTSSSLANNVKSTTKLSLSTSSATATNSTSLFSIPQPVTFTSPSSVFKASSAHGVHPTAPSGASKVSFAGSGPSLIGGNTALKHSLRLETDETDKEIESPFYFESDHVSLKGNRDYQTLLRTVAKLEAQRMKAITDLDELQDVRDNALADPIKFVQRLQLRQDMGIPEAIKVAELPNTPWEKYTKNLDFHLANTKRKFPSRHKRGGSSARSSPVPFRASESPTLIPCEPQAHHSGSESGLSEPIVVRGRVKDSQKPSSFNQLWHGEEQKHLEELLIEFPPEEVEARRWEKIAKALGKRTTQQVASRVQKYFIKLAKAGLPVPGRMPNVGNYNKKGSHKHQRYNRFYFQPSTFLTSYEPPVYMSDEDEGSAGYSGYREGAARYSGDTEEGSQEEEYAISDEEDIPAELRDSEEYQEILRLKKAKKRKLTHDSTTNEHIGYKCDMCACEPIVGTRWHCQDCPPGVSVDCCDECIDCEFETHTHNGSHQMAPIYLRPQALAPTMDRDYTRFMTGDYNYLDPNYLPAS